MKNFIKVSVLASNCKGISVCTKSALEVEEVLNTASSSKPRKLASWKYAYNGHSCNVALFKRLYAILLDLDLYPRSASINIELCRGDSSDTIFVARVNNGSKVRDSHMWIRNPEATKWVFYSEADYDAENPESEDFLLYLDFKPITCKSYPSPNAIKYGALVLAHPAKSENGCSYADDLILTNAPEGGCHEKVH